jgi:rubrerythrin
MKKEELNIISQAILNEVEGYEFYKMAANQKGTKESKNAFLELANEELKHAQYLKTLFNIIKEDKEDDKNLAFESSPPSPNIYNWENVDNDFTALAVSVFSIGMQMERDSIKFYENAREKIENKKARQLFDLLIKWEQVHLEQFTEQYNKYKKTWLIDQWFAPF